jgi:hypothetical protein
MRDCIGVVPIEQKNIPVSLNPIRLSLCGLCDRSMPFENTLPALFLDVIREKSQIKST